MLRNKARGFVTLLIALAAPPVFAQTAGADDSAVERHGISRIVPITLHDGANVVLRFIQNKYEGAIHHGLFSDGRPGLCHHASRRDRLWNNSS